MTGGGRPQVVPTGGLPGVCVGAVFGRPSWTARAGKMERSEAGNGPGKPGPYDVFRKCVQGRISSARGEGRGDGLLSQCAHWRAMTGPFHQAFREVRLRQQCSSRGSRSATLGFAPTPPDAETHSYSPPARAQPVEGPQVFTAPVPTAPHPPTCTFTVQVGSLKRLFFWTVHGPFSFRQDEKKMGGATPRPNGRPNSSILPKNMTKGKTIIKFG